MTRFLWFILEPCARCPPPIDLKMRKCLGPTGDVPLYGNQHCIHFVEENTTTSSLTIKIRVSEEGLSKIIGTVVYYRTRFGILTAPTLEWNQTIGYYIATDQYSLFDGGVVGSPFYRHSASPSIQEIIVLSNLRFPGTIYLVEVDSHLEHDVWRNAVMEVSTLPIKPSNPPKTGTGCFRVYDVGIKSRHVRVYWQHPDDYYRMYEVFVYEDGNKTAAYTNLGFMRNGFIWVHISLKLHTVVFRSLNDGGRSENSSIVIIPAQKDVLPALTTMVYKNKKKNLYVLTWSLVEVEEASITNYTLFWYDTRAIRKVLSVQDFVYLDRRTPKVVKVKGDHWVGLAISVNTATGSSGLQPVRYDDHDLFMLD